MYVINGICYAGKQEEKIEVSSIRILDGGMLLVTFSTGEVRLFDVLRLLSKGPVFAALANEENRKTAQVTSGFVSWMDGEIDLAPETMYQESYPYTPKSCDV